MRVPDPYRRKDTWGSLFGGCLFTLAAILISLLITAASVALTVFIVVLVLQWMGVL